MRQHKLASKLFLRGFLFLRKALPDNKERAIAISADNVAETAVRYKADFSSPNVLIYPALQDRQYLKSFANAMAREVLTNDEGLATGVSYVNKEDMMEYQVTGKVVILAASTCEIARLLLNSKSPRHPNGLSQ